MDKQKATQHIRDTFNYPFDEGRFRNFIINLLNDVDEGKKFDYLSGNESSKIRSDRSVETLNQFEVWISK